MVWIIVIVTGLARDGCMALFVASIVDRGGVGAVYSGTAVGLVQTLVRIGRFTAPPLGNSLASNNAGLPFLVWAGFALAGLLNFSFVRNIGYRTA